MSGKFFIHSPDDWSEAEVEEIKTILEQLGYSHDRSAAIGEGAGGAGFETVVEVLLTNPISTGIISAAVYDIVKVLYRKRPTAKKLPQNIPKLLDRYRLVLHVDNDELHTIVSVNLKEDIRTIETAVVVKLEDKLKANPWRLDQNGKDWDVY